MTAIRAGHSATVLTDGRVLVAGGSATPSAEIFDPATGAWRATPLMQDVRGGHTATLLADGRVLVAGGGSVVVGDRLPEFGPPRVFGPSASAELFDPQRGEWTPTGSLGTPRGAHTATRLHDGRVLVVGGFAHRGGEASGSLASAEIYDPVTGTWSETAAMPAPRHEHAAFRLADGRVLVLGGEPIFGFSAVDIYDPVSASWQAASPLPEFAFVDFAVSLADGRILVGGRFGTGFFDVAPMLLTYDPESDGWETTANTPLQATPGPTYYRGALLRDGQVLVLGGDGLTHRYDPSARSWAADGPMLQARRNQTESVLPDGRVLVTGGLVALQPVASAEIYQLGSTSRDLPAGASVREPTAHRIGSPSRGLQAAARAWRPREPELAIRCRLITDRDVPRQRKTTRK
jgi:hypothetical protein